MYRQVSKSGQIAAQAISLGLVVVTNNEKDFGAIPGIAIENWTMP